MTEMIAKNKIAIVVCAWPPGGGGIGNNAYYQARQLAALGYEVTAFTPAYDGQSFAGTVDGYRLVKSPALIASGKAALTPSLYRQLAGHDVVHLYYPFFGNDLLVWWFIFRHRSKLIVHYQMDAIGKGWKKYFFYLHIKLFLPFIVGAASRVIILSEDHARHSYLRSCYHRHQNVFTVVPNGVDTDIFTPGDRDPELAAKYDIGPDDQILIFVGGLDEQHYFKGVEVLLLSLQKLKDQHGHLKLLIIGDGGWREKYQQQARDLGIADRVIFAGWVVNEQLPAYYRLANIFILPSTAGTESFGIVIAEAQACGVPAIVSNWPGSRQTIEPEVTGLLVDPGSVADLTAKINSLLSDNLRLQKMAEQSRQRVVANYDWRVVADKIDKLYRSL